MKIPKIKKKIKKKGTLSQENHTTAAGNAEEQ